MATMHEALVELQAAVDPAVEGSVTIFPPAKAKVQGEYGWVEPNTLSMGGIHPTLYAQGTFSFRVAVRVAGTNLQDRAERMTDLLDPLSEASLQQAIWDVCGPEIRFDGVTWGVDDATQEYGANLIGSIPIIRDLT